MPCSTIAINMNILLKSMIALWRIFFPGGNRRETKCRASKATAKAAKGQTYRSVIGGFLPGTETCRSTAPVIGQDNDPIGNGLRGNWMSGNLNQLALLYSWAKADLHSFATCQLTTISPIGPTMNKVIHLAQPTTPRIELLPNWTGDRAAQELDDVAQSLIAPI